MIISIFDPFSVKSDRLLGDICSQALPWLAARAGPCSCQVGLKPCPASVLGGFVAEDRKVSASPSLFTTLPPRPREHLVLIRLEPIEIVGRNRLAIGIRSDDRPLS